MTDAEKEQIKLRANYLNGLALLFAGLGALGPAFAIYHRILSSMTFDVTELKTQVLVALVMLCAGGFSSFDLHRQAQRELKKLSPCQSGELSERKINASENEEMKK